MSTTNLIGKTQAVSGRTFRAYTPVELTDLEFDFNLPVLFSDEIFGIVNLPREDRLFTADHVARANAPAPSFHTPIFSVLRANTTAATEQI